MFRVGNFNINGRDWGIFEVSDVPDNGKCAINWMAGRIEVLHELPQHDRESLARRALLRVIQSCVVCALPHRPHLTVVELEADPPPQSPLPQATPESARRSA